MVKAISTVYLLIECPLHVSLDPASATIYPAKANHFVHSLDPATNLLIVPVLAPGLAQCPSHTMEFLFLRSLPEQLPGRTSHLSGSTLRPLQRPGIP